VQPITTEQATIRTATVEVKTLTLGRRQMTLSVFRQLPDFHIISNAVVRGHDWKLDLLGDPWGRVNYFWDGCGYGNSVGPHLHVVWVQGSRLLRACVGRLHLVYPSERPKVKGDTHALAWLGAVDDLDSQNYPCANYCEVDPGEIGWVKEQIRRWNVMYERLAALDQLFIAV
jgi:hypothetical protein